MGAGHSHALYVHRHSPVHALEPEVKIAASVLFTVAVVATPREALWAFGAYLAVIVAVALTARIGLGEGVITAITVTYVAKVRPDLVYAVRNLRRPVVREAVSV